MIYLLTFRLRWALCAVVFAMLSSATQAEGDNLVANGSFEAAGSSSTVANGWYGDRGVYSRDADVARSGGASLKYANADAKRYRLCMRPVKLKGGWKCRFSVWVKTKEIAGNGSGASICLEWSDANGKWLGGTYPKGVKGSRGWTKIEAVTRVPANPANFSLSCYVRKGMTGTAWFDDVELVRLVEAPIKSMLLSPVYRGRVTDDGPKDIRARVQLNLADLNLAPQQVKIAARIVSVKGGGSFGSATHQPRDTEPFVISIRPPKLKPGRYQLVITLSGPGGKLLCTLSSDLVRTPKDFAPTCTIDSRQRLIVRGKPFFPIGMYWSGISEKDLKIYSTGKFNCVMPYGRTTRKQMDLAHKYGIKVIYSVKNLYAGSKWCPANIKTLADEKRAVLDKVRSFRDHPALLAWYLNDELPQSYMPRLKAHQEWVAAADPNHPTWAVLFQYRQVADYIETFDVIGTDPYPIPDKPASQAGLWTAETHRQTQHARPMWQVPQLHNWANYRKTAAAKKGQRTPTEDEVRSMAWQCICNGATGLVFYSWRDVQRNPDVPFETQWTYLKKIAAEIDIAAPMLLSIDPPPAVKPAAKPSWLNWLARSYKNKGYIFAVNNGDGEGAVTFTLDKQVRTVRVIGEGRSIEVKDGAFTDTFKKLQVRIYELNYRPARVFGPASKLSSALLAERKAF